MIDSETIQTAGRLLSENAGNSRVILFGSYARGDAQEVTVHDTLG